MPTYQYTCTSCGENLEVVQSFSDASLTECPECKGALRKVFSPVGIVFKGSGFYRTDSRSTGKGGAKGATSSLASSPTPADSTAKATPAKEPAAAASSATPSSSGSSASTASASPASASKAS